MEQVKRRVGVGRREKSRGVKKKKQEEVKSEN